MKLFKATLKATLLLLLFYTVTIGSIQMSKDNPELLDIIVRIILVSIIFSTAIGVFYYTSKSEVKCKCHQFTLKIPPSIENYPTKDHVDFQLLPPVFDLDNSRSQLWEIDYGGNIELHIVYPDGKVEYFNDFFDGGAWLISKQKPTSVRYEGTFISYI